MLNKAKQKHHNLFTHETSDKKAHLAVLDMSVNEEKKRRVTFEGYRRPKVNGITLQGCQEIWKKKQYPEN